MQLKISTRIWQKSQCRKMADSCAVSCLLVHCFIFGSCFCTWYLQLFLKLLQRIIIHFMKWIYFTRPTGHWFAYFFGNIPLLSDLCSVLQGCVHWDIRTSWAMVLLHDLVMRGVTVFNDSCENTRVTKLFGRWKQPEFSCCLLAVSINVGPSTIFSPEYELLYWWPIDRWQFHCVTFQAAFSYYQGRFL